MRRNVLEMIWSDFIQEFNDKFYNCMAMKAQKIEFNNIKKLPDDLFLETIPYEETREYGRKLVGSAAMYAWLYYDKEIAEEISEIVK